MRTSVAIVVAMAASLAVRADEVDRKHPLDAQLKVLADDVRNPKYRQLVIEKMLVTDLAAEWQRAATADNADSFLKKHGGKDKVLADADLKAAYERRVKIRTDFYDLMREGYRKHKATPPFDKGATAETAGTVSATPGARKVTVRTVLPSPDADKHWSRFRGPSGQGETSAPSLPTTWDKNGKNLAWRTSVPGVGNSSPIVWGDRIFLTSATPKGETRSLHCFRASDGKLLWTKQAPSTPPEPSVRDKNGYASATPVTDGERVISFLGSCGLVCHDFEGNLLWKHDLTIKTTHGTGSSPVLYQDLVILAQDQNQAPSIFVALDKRTGKVVWEGKRAKGMTWNTPIVVRVDERDELIVVGAGTVRAYDPKSGGELWTLDGPTVEVVPTVVVGPGALYSASGRNGPTIAFVPGGAGNVTKTNLLWRAVRGGPHVPTPILHKGRLYTANDTGIFSCLDAATGDLRYLERVDDRFSASPVAAGDLLYFPAESGVTYVVRATEKFDIVAQNDLGAPILASPAVVGGRMFLRTAAELVCVAEPK